MRNTIICILTLVVHSHLFAQNANWTFYKTTKKSRQHIVEINNDIAKVYQIGLYLDKAGSGPAILIIDTLYKKTEFEFSGKLYSFNATYNNNYLLTNQSKKLETEKVNDTNSIYTILNNAHYLKSYFDLSDSINKMFPLYYYSFRNGYYAWNRLSQKNYNYEEFKQNTNAEIKKLYDSIVNKQTNLANTTNFIIKNANQTDYTALRDSLRKLPIEFRSSSWYFGEAVYQISLTDPEYFFRIAEDFPSDKSIVFAAVDSDKNLVKRLKQVQGHDNIKKEFIKEYKFGKSMPYKIIGGYAVLGGLLTWLILNQK